jgi:hypothetical protein
MGKSVLGIYEHGDSLIVSCAYKNSIKMTKYCLAAMIVEAMCCSNICCNNVVKSRDAAIRCSNLLQKLVLQQARYVAATFSNHVIDAAMRCSYLSRNFFRGTAGAVA